MKHTLCKAEQGLGLILQLLLHIGVVIRVCFCKDRFNSFNAKVDVS